MKKFNKKTTNRKRPGLLAGLNPVGPLQQAAPLPKMDTREWPVATLAVLPAQAAAGKKFVVIQVSDSDVVNLMKLMKMGLGNSAGVPRCIRELVGLAREINKGWLAGKY